MSNRYILKFLFLLVICTTLNAPVQAQLRLPDIFSDNMVLQAETVVSFRGWANPTDTIEVVASWVSADTLSTVVPPDAEWSVSLKTPKAGGPYKITVIGDTTLVIHNILIGQDWLASGQSNMELSPNWYPNYFKKMIKNVRQPQIRLFKVAKMSAAYPQKELHGSWKICDTQNLWSFSAVAYFFGKTLQEKLHQPIGLIESAWGGTPVEAWTPKAVFKRHEKLAFSAAKLTPAHWGPRRPSVIFNAMVHPLVDFPIVGVIWYQGATNRFNPSTYKETFSKMIRAWRWRWGKDFPFYFVQIAPYTYKKPYVAALIREAQLETYRQVPQTGIVITTDITGDTTIIHPKDKQDVGERLGRWALAKTYGMNHITYSGPLYRSMDVKNHKAIIHFDYADSGLVKHGSHLRDFYIAGKDRHFVPAHAKINGSTVVVSSPEVRYPIAVRMGFSNAAVPNLFNKAGLPASPFRTDDWPVKTRQ